MHLMSEWPYTRSGSHISQLCSSLIYGLQGKIYLTTPTQTSTLPHLPQLVSEGSIGHHQNKYIVILEFWWALF